MSLLGFQTYLEFFEVMIEEDFDGQVPGQAGRAPGGQRRQNLNASHEVNSNPDQVNQEILERVEPKKKIKFLKRSEFLNGIPKYFIK